MLVSSRAVHGVTNRRDVRPEGLKLLKQVHGTKIVVVRSGETAPEGVEADGWLSDAPDQTFAVYTADCIPLFMTGGGFVGVFHAGWRGVAGGMARAAVEAFDAVGVNSSVISAWAGPFIRQCCFRVGPEVAEKFKFVKDSRVDLAAETRAQLESKGVTNISLEGPCTCCNPADWFSYRRDKSGTGRMYGWIRLEA
jgi:YfiH family protein